MLLREPVSLSLCHAFHTTLLINPGMDGLGLHLCLLPILPPLFWSVKHSDQGMWLLEANHMASNLHFATNYLPSLCKYVHLWACVSSFVLWE